MTVDIKEKKREVKPYMPEGKEKEMQDFLKARIAELKEHRKKTLDGTSKTIEDLYREADREYPPHSLEFTERKRFESDDELGLRSRLVNINDQDAWRSDGANPDLFVKVNTALAILIEQNPEAVFMASSRKYEENTQLAYGNWKNSWETTGAKQQLKNFVFNQFKYGTGFLRTYPKKIIMNKKIRTEYYEDQPDKDKYVDKKIVKCNDIYRESLNPKRVWLSESARVGDWNSVGDWYFEKDYTWDQFQIEFENFKNFAHIDKGMNLDNEVDDNKENKINKDSITVGFYENDKKDIYALFIPSADIVLYSCPLPNDDGMLSLSYAPLYLRSDEYALGISIWEVIKNDSVMYDRFSNMTMDQLTLSIYKMFFYKGTNLLGENGQLRVSPGLGEQVADPSGVKFLEIPGPGREAWDGLKFLQDRKDFNSGVPAQLSAQFTGKTLGQDIQAKETALDRLKTPLDYLLDALQQEAYICLSWQKQTLSTPEIIEYTDIENLKMALKEFGMDDAAIEQYLADAQTQNPESQLLFNSEPDEAGAVKQYANVYPEISYNLEQDEQGELIESDKARFYRFGVDLPTKRLEWHGIIRIKPQSVLAPSKDLTRRMKLDFYNLVYPSIQAMLASPNLIPFLLPPIKQIVKIYEENINDWVDEEKLMQLYEASQQPIEAAPEPPKLSFSIKFEMLAPDAQRQVLEKYAGITVAVPVPEELFVDKAQVQGQLPSGQENVELFVDKGAVSPETGAPTIEPIVPRGSLSTAKTTAGALSEMNQLE